MPTTFNFKDVIDLPSWRPIGNSLSANLAGVGLAEDPRNNEDRNPDIYQFSSATGLNKFNFKNDGWTLLPSPAMAGTFGAGAGICYMASAGPSGQLSAGWTNTRGALLSALPASVGFNQLANRGDGTQGFKIRIIGLSAGKTEERYIVGNTASNTPVITIDTPLSFTPLSSDRYEMLSGRVYLLNAGALAAGIWRAYDIATNSYITLNQVNLPATISTDTTFACLDELATPITQAPGNGIFGVLSASAASLSGLTGATGGADANLLSSQYANFQIRVLTDPVSTNSVGQRRRINSHTSANPTVYSLGAAWTITPSASAQYVVEYNGDILCWTSAAATTYAYAGGGFRADTTASWSTNATAATGVGLSAGINLPAQYAVRPAVMGAGCAAWVPYGITSESLSTLSSGGGFRPSFVYSIRGGNNAIIDYIDIAAGTIPTAAGSWPTTMVYANSGVLFSTGTCCCYDPVTNNGRYAYINPNGSVQTYRYDTRNNVLEPWEQIRYAQGAATVGKCLATAIFIDGTTKIGSIIMGRQSNVEFWQCFSQR